MNKVNDYKFLMVFVLTFFIGMSASAQDCSAFTTAPVNLTKSFNPVNGIQDRVQLKWFKASPLIRYSDADAAMCDIKFWEKKALSPCTGAPIGALIVNPDTVLMQNVKKTYVDGSPRGIFKWPVKFRSAADAPTAKKADANLRYGWQVRCECGHDGAGPESPWSDVKIFNTPDFDVATGIYAPLTTIYLPAGLTTGPAIVQPDCLLAPTGYVAAASQPCAEAVIADNPFCLKSEWDGLCQDAYDLCVDPIEFDCPELSLNIGDDCNDGDANTENDIVHPGCTCIGTQVLTPCPTGVGLEGVIVEKYYVSDADDAMDSDGGSLPEGSVTYRVYIDMADGYELETVYGAGGSPLTFDTTTEFFNNEDRGATSGHLINDSRLDENTVALDSWIAFGGASDAHLGVLKPLDTNGSIVGGTNNDGGSEGTAGGLLVNDDPSAGIPLTVCDGLVSGTPPALTVIGDMVGALNTHFDDVNSSGGFISVAGAYSTIGGLPGTNSENQILIGQFTTTGDFSFSLNFRLDGPSGFEDYLHIDCDGLSYSSAPTDPFSVDTFSNDKTNKFESGIYGLVHPNPNNGEQLKLKLSGLSEMEGAVQVRVFDLTGKSIYQGAYSVSGKAAQLIIHPSEVLSPGSYVVEVMVEGQSAQMQMVVLR
jgi:hypothetical protein